MIRIITNVAPDSLQDFTISVSDDDQGIPAGAVVVIDTPGRRAKVLAWEALCRIRERRHKRSTDRAWLIAARAGRIATI